MSDARPSLLALRDLRRWVEQTLDEAPELGYYMRSVWERGGKLRCAHCGRPVYWDNGAGNSSGYCIHAGHNAVDGKNGLYCSPAGWTPEGATTAHPRDRVDDAEAVARTVLALLNGEEIAQC